VFYLDWILLSILSALFLSFHDVFRKKILKKEHSLELLSVTFITILIIQSSLIPYYSLNISLENLLFTFLRSISMALSLVLFTKALKHMEISLVAPLNNLTPLFLIFFSSIFLFEKITFFQILGISLIVLGSYFLQVHSNYLNPIKHLKLLKNKYIIYAILSSFFLAISAVISKHILKTTNVMTYLFYSYLFITIFFVFATFIVYKGFKDIKNGFSKGLYIIPVIALLFLFSDWAYFVALAMPTVLVSLVIPIRRLSTLFSVLFGGSLFKEHYFVHKIVSSLVILLGVFFVVV
jgi:bacterial/archaeal transporter family protein